ncbi:chorismate mutase [Pararhodospirillum photometricum]|uniref:chorismate mutase n=1 Tax=Pararhodospirillum photometricum TaxID=1084 RepID=UPI0012FF28E2|nr:chorismate mutase [Pararhodospirillum photometricum]
MTDPSSSLDPLRAEIDAIDDAIHDQIMRRAQLADQIRIAKMAEGSAVYLRPGREAAVLRRLVARHSGPFPRRVLIRLWREIFSVVVSMQGRITMAVWMPERGAGYLELARNQYGSFTSATVHQSVGQVVQEVGEGRATVGVVPLPRHEDPVAWWPALMSSLPGTPRVHSSASPVTGGRARAWRPLSWPLPTEGSGEAAASPVFPFPYPCAFTTVPVHAHSGTANARKAGAMSSGGGRVSGSSPG